MAALLSAAQVVPREPEQAPDSAPAILARWRDRAGVALSDTHPSAENGAEGANGAWEVRAACGSCWRTWGLATEGLLCKAPHAVFAHCPSRCTGGASTLQKSCQP